MTTLDIPMVAFITALIIIRVLLGVAAFIEWGVEWLERNEARRWKDV